jgi:hypothetical protein
MLLGKFTHTLGVLYQFRHTEKKDRTNDDHEILSVELDEPTDFGQQGRLLCWYGGEQDFDWKKYQESTIDDSGMSIYFFGFQIFLNFFTEPTKSLSTRKFTIYIPKNDWGMWQDIVIEEFYYHHDQPEAESTDIERLMIKAIGEKYQLKSISDTFLNSYP